MNKPALFGVIWFALFYAVSFVVLRRAERGLDQSVKDQLRDVRRPLRPLPFLFVVGLLPFLFFRPSWVWLYLIVGVLTSAALVGFAVGRSGLPHSFKSVLSIAMVSLVVGIIGAAVMFGYANAFAL